MAPSVAVAAAPMSFGGVKMEQQRPASTSEWKVVAKSVLVAAQLAKRQSSPLTQKRRMLVLLASLAAVSRSLGLGTRLLHVDSIVETLCELAAFPSLDKLAHYASNQPLQLVKLVVALRQTRKRKILVSMTRKLAQRQSHREPLRPLGFPNPHQRLIPKPHSEPKHSQLPHGQEETARLQEKHRHLAARFHALLRSKLCAHFKRWREGLNSRLVAHRRNQRVKHRLMSGWRRCQRVTAIARLFHGKKLKLRHLNRWFGRRFGRTKQKLLTMRLNSWMAAKQRREMYADAATLAVRETSCVPSSKRLIRVWRAAVWRRRIAHTFARRRLLGDAFNRYHLLAALRIGQLKSARLYSELRLLRGTLYPWHTLAVGDRAAFRTAQLHIRVGLLRRILQTWRTVAAQQRYLNAAAWPLTRVQTLRRVIRGFSQWRRLCQDHVARSVWTLNFRSSEQLRHFWALWRLHAQQQITADSIRQRALALAAFSKWNQRASARRDQRLLLQNSFLGWKRLVTTRRHLRFFHGQRMLRTLAALRAAPEALTAAVTRHCHLTTGNNQTTSLLTAWQRWRAAARNVQGSSVAASVLFGASNLRRKLKIWRLSTAEANVIRSEPKRRLIAAYKTALSGLQRRLEHQAVCDYRLLDYYTQRARLLESMAWTRWTANYSASKHRGLLLNARLLAWQAAEKTRKLHRWQLATAALFFKKCQALTGKHRTWAAWRARSRIQAVSRRARSVGKMLHFWRHAAQNRSLQRRSLQCRARWLVGRTLTVWRRQSAVLWSIGVRAAEVSAVSQGRRKLRLWRQRAQARAAARLLLLRQHRIVPRTR